MRSKMNTLTAVAVATLLVAAATAAHAQTPDGWKVTVAPYLMGAAMNGTTAVAGQQVDVDMSASDIFSHLQFGAMGLSWRGRAIGAPAATRCGCHSAPTAPPQARSESRAAPT